MAKLIINNDVVDAFFDPSTPEESIQLLISENYPENSKWRVELDDLEKASLTKSNIHSAIAKRFGVAGNAQSSLFSLIGKIGDPASLSIDAMVRDIIATDETATTDYAKAKIHLFEEQHGVDSWIGAAAFAREWHAGRSTGEISMPFDDKGLAEVIEESAELGGFVRELLAAMKAPIATEETEAPA